MIATAILFLAIAAVALVAQHARIETLTTQRDDAVILRARAEANADDALADLAAETRAHAETKALVASLEADLIEAGREASTHAGHLEALIEATQDTPLTLVKGGRHG